ncbi:hypothetical protein MKK67_17645 [Methylobacterium sp. J-072]|uniref:hypothetical protein n=1 Tax=Methylobacterium sp. J-072 TaxID=2836651 RepID=UPI001FBA5851|nr:hypothetical protein [Methylobacterium sp. J-072]MCJ2094302.1 hypothetical protein [Methylobacterium sp. J-072]
MTMSVGHFEAIPTDHALEAERQDRESMSVCGESPPGLGEEGTTAFVPQCRSESASAYGLRTAGEILSRYLMD